MFHNVMSLSHGACAGEVACTGLHGANRLASTSLLEGLVWGCSIVDHLADRTNSDSKDGLAASADLGALVPPNIPKNGENAASTKTISSAWKDLRCVYVCVSVCVCRGLTVMREARSDVVSWLF